MRLAPMLRLTAATTLGVLASASAAAACSNDVFRDGPAAQLPDCRAWEQVSPVEKNGNSPVTGGLISGVGDRAAFNGKTALANADGAPAEAVYSAVRDTAWTTRGADPAYDVLGNGFVFLATGSLSEDLDSAVVFSTRKLSPDATEGDSNLYVHDLGDGTYRLAFSQPGEALFRDLKNDARRFVAETPDQSRFAFYSPLRLTAGAVADGDNLYEWDGQRLRLASVLPDGAAATGSQVPGSRAPREERPMSTDGRRLTMVLADVNRPTGLYQRVDGRTTTLISRSHRSTGQPGEPVPIDGSPWASADGSVVTFADAQSGPLTNASPADGTGRIYRWRADGDRLEDLLAEVTSVAATRATLRWQSPDGRYVWFSAPSVLRPGATDGANNLYVLDTSSTTLSLVHSSPQDVALGFSPNGRRIVVVDGQAYSFDAERPGAGTTCASCGAAGVPRSPVHAVTSNETFYFSGLFPHPVTDDGRVFFDTPDPLLPSDANRVSDVYEYAPGRGLSLISSGVGANPATFGTVTADGRDAYFLTRDPLVGQDTDDLVDVYDARVGGGILAQRTAVAAKGSCRGDDCRNGVPTSPVLGLPAEPAPAAHPRPTFRLLRPSSTLRRRAARHGHLVVKVRVSGAGKLSVGARAKVSGVTRTVGSASRTVTRAQTSTLTLRLSAAARRKLRRTRRLALALTASFTGAVARQSASVTLERPSRSHRGGAR